MRHLDWTGLDWKPVCYATSGQEGIDARPEPNGTSSETGIEQLGQVVGSLCGGAIPGEIQGQQFCDESDRGRGDWFLFKRFTVRSRGLLRNGADVLM